LFFAAPSGQHRRFPRLRIGRNAFCLSGHFLFCTCFRVRRAVAISSLLISSLLQLEPPPHSLADSFFLIEDIQPQIITDPDNYEGPVMVQPKPIYQVKPDNPQSGHGTVLVNVQLDQPRHVVNAKIRQSAGQALDEGALRAASQWEFSPMQIRGKPVPTTTVLRFDF
jgi:TonB family protein